MEKEIVYWNKFPDYTPTHIGGYMVSDGTAVYTAYWIDGKFVNFVDDRAIEDKTIKAWLSSPQIPDFLK